jgi:hypothetical protein
LTKKLSGQWLFLLTVVLAVAVLVIEYWPSFNHYFFGDDFYNIWISRAQSISDVVNFFNIFRDAGSFPFYRPLTIQLFFYLVTASGQVLNPTLAHLVLFSSFLVVGLLVFLLSSSLTKSRTVAGLTSFFYIFSASHFFRLYFVSQIQETTLTITILLSILFFDFFLESRKKIYYLLSFTSFIIGLTAKESALMITPFILLLLWYRGGLRKNLAYLWPYIGVSCLYVLARVLFFGFPFGGSDYRMDFHPLKVANTYFWYFLWSLGYPEDLVNLDLFNSQTIINFRVLISFGEIGAMAIFLLTFFLLQSLLGLKFILEDAFSKKNKDWRLVLFCVVWFLLSLFMVAFYQFHKFIYSTTLALFAVSLTLALFAYRISRFSRIIFIMLIFLYFYSQLISQRYSYRTSWNIKRGILSKAAFEYLDRHYIKIPVDSTLVFREYREPVCRFVPYPKIKELSYAMGEDKAFKVKYGPQIEVYYVDNITTEDLSRLRKPILVDVAEIINQAKYKEANDYGIN